MKNINTILMHGRSLSNCTELTTAVVTSKLPGKMDPPEIESTYNITKQQT